jgi:hypothetical protein
MAAEGLIARTATRTLYELADDFNVGVFQDASATDRSHIRIAGLETRSFRQWKILQWMMV